MPGQDAMRFGLGPQVLRQPGGARGDLEGLQNGVSDAGLVSSAFFLGKSGEPPGFYIFVEPQIGWSTLEKAWLPLEFGYL